MARGQGGTLGGFTPLSTPNAPTDLSVSTSIGSATVSFTPPTDTGDAAITSFIVTAIGESAANNITTDSDLIATDSTNITADDGQLLSSIGATGSASPITISLDGGTFKIRAQAVNGFGPGRLTEFSTGNAVFSGAELYTWGNNGIGQLGQGDTVYRSSPVQVGALTDWSLVSARQGNIAFIKTNNTMWTVGSAFDGQLGIGISSFNVDRSSPVQVGGGAVWSQVSVGGTGFMAAVRTNGTLWAWGNNNNLQLGFEPSYKRSTPQQIGALTNWSKVSCGDGHVVAVKTDATMWSWGTTNNGALGSGVGDAGGNRSSPRQIGSGINWAQASAGYLHCAAISTSGSLYAWGYGGRGQLGINSTGSQYVPNEVGALTNWTQVSCGHRHTTAIKTDGTLWAWGENTSYGALGDGTVINRSSPVQIGPIANWSRVSAGFKFTVAVKTDGTMWAWGRNNSGQLGQNNVIHRSSPVQVGALTNWLQAAAGFAHTSALDGVI